MQALKEFCSWEAAEDQTVGGEESNALEDKQGQSKSRQEDSISIIGSDPHQFSSIGFIKTHISRHKDPLRSIGPDRHWFEDPAHNRKPDFFAYPWSIQIWWCVWRFNPTENQIPRVYSRSISAIPYA